VLSAITPAQQGKHASLMGATTPMQQGWCPPCDVRAKRSAQYGQQHWRNKGNSIHAMLVMVPAQQGSWCHCDNSKDACASTMAMMPLWQVRQHQLDDGNNAITMRATTLLHWWERHLDYKDTCASKTATQLQQGWRCQLDNSKDTCTLMTAMYVSLVGNL
jgi:hypothetical protein